MPRYGPPPSDEPESPEPPDDDRSSLTKWSWRAKVLAVIAGFGMVAAFVFEFLPPTSSGSSKQTSTSVVATTTTVLSTTTVLPTTSTSIPATSTTG